MAVFAVAGDGFFHSSFLFQRIAKSELGVGVSGLEPDGLVEGKDGLVVLFTSR